MVRRPPKDYRPKKSVNTATDHVGNNPITVTNRDLKDMDIILTAQVIEYMRRWEMKGEVKDLKKAKRYLKTLISIQP